MAVAEDAALIAQQRKQMFDDAGQAEGAGMGRMETNFVEWVRPRLEDGRYLGWLVEQDGVAIGGAGVWLMDFPPHWMDAEPVRAYLLNFYVAPEHRGKGWAKRLLDLTVAETKRHGVKVATLHASKFGKPIYEKNGFKGTNEMMLVLGESA
jgi:GNAT superfamily N-acetyltransferase